MHVTTRRLSMLSVLAALGATAGASAEGPFDITSIRRFAQSSTLGFIPGVGTVVEDLDGETTTQLGPVSFANDAGVDEEGFTLFAQVSSESDAGPDRIRGTASTGVLLSAVPESGIALVESFTRLDAEFRVLQPVSVRLTASVIQDTDDTNPGFAARVLLSSNAFGFEAVELSVVNNVPEPISVELMLPTGLYRLQCDGGSVFDNPPAFVGQLSHNASWSVDLVALPAGFCPGDCDGTGAVDFNDLVSMLFAFGDAEAPLACDADVSGSIDFNDLVATLFLFGPCE